MKHSTIAALLLLAGILQSAAAKEKHYIYAASPGIRNYLEYGGMGIVVFDIDDNYRPVRRIPTWDAPAAGQEAENVKGIAASGKTGVVFVSTIKRLAAFDAVTGKKLWDKELDGGVDRMALSPDGNTIYAPSFEGPHWNVVNAANGDVIAKIEPKSGAHNTIYSPDGKHAYLAGLKSPLLTVADTSTHKSAMTVGPFSDVIRPFTINGNSTLVYVNLNNLLGFEIGDLRTGKKLHRVEVQGYKIGPVKRHGCPSHGIALSPDEKEIWLADGANSAIHIFDATVMPPKQLTTLKVRDQPGWISFSIDGKQAYSSTGEIFDAKSKRLIKALTDEDGRQFMSEKLLEIVIDNDKVVRAGNQFGIGGKK